MSSVNETLPISFPVANYYREIETGSSQVVLLGAHWIIKWRSDY